MLIKEDKIKIIITITEYLIISIIEINLITNPKNGGIPPKDIIEIIILIFSLIENLFLISPFKLIILFFFKNLKIELIIKK